MALDIELYRRTIYLPVGHRQQNLRQIEFRSELPKNFVGKVLRRLLVDA
jgi:acyl-coenzyme A synthetase/AMP-(fatty) acid ligase